jgi:hypothetical protein
MIVTVHCVRPLSDKCCPCSQSMTATETVSHDLPKKKASHSLCPLCSLSYPHMVLSTTAACSAWSMVMRFSTRSSAPDRLTRIGRPFCQDSSVCVGPSISQFLPPLLQYLSTLRPAQPHHHPMRRGGLIISLVSSPRLTLFNVRI